MSVVILGGGIIGLSIAYYVSLAQPDRKICIVDSADHLLLSASGFSGGLIVRDWFSPAVLSLAQLSFQLHEQLAEAHDGGRKWGYSASTAFSLVREDKDDAGVSTGKKIRGEDWLLHGNSRAEVARQFTTVPKSQAVNSKVQRDAQLNDDDSPLWATPQKNCTLERISGDRGCAQVEPKELCEWLLQACQAKGVQVRLRTRATSLVRDGRGDLQGINVEDQSNPSRPTTTFLGCADVILAAGCWTPTVFAKLLGQKMRIDIKPLPGYSVVVRSPRYASAIKQVAAGGEPTAMAHSIFCAPGPDWTYSPEAMARMTRSGKPEIYVAGLNVPDLALPDFAHQTKQLMEKAKSEDLKRTAVALTGLASNQPENQNDLELVREGLCFRPLSASGVPIISKVDGIRSQCGGVYVAAGHGPWGITLSLATGLVVAEMLQGKRLSADISELDLRQDVSRLASRL